jgi:threonine/homoserine/homoserine lactone efflux protein
MPIKKNGQFVAGKNGMSFKVLILFLITETLLCLSPGPAVLLVVSQGLSRGAIASVWSSIGILTGNAIYFLISATGIAALLISSGKAFVVLTVVGAAYTLWLGVKTFFGSVSALALGSTGEEEIPRKKMFLNRFVLQFANPRTLIFFTAVLPSSSRSAEVSQDKLRSSRLPASAWSSWCCARMARWRVRCRDSRRGRGLPRSSIGSPERCW